MNRKIIYIECLLLLMLTGSLLWHRVAPFPAGSTDTGANKATSSDAPKYIKWVDFDVTSDAMKQALQLDMNSYQKEVHFDWIDLLAYLGAKYGGDFSKYRSQDMKDLAEKLQNGETLEALTKDMKYFSYYKEAYGAVLGGMVGLYEIQVPPSEVPASMLSESGDGETDENKENVWLTKYGLKAFSPIAKNYPYTDFDDFGTSRSYGYRRQHLGHDLMGQVGTPVIAVESGYVEAIGWNQYGGWRLGIRSFDKKRYYYYAHLRKNYPYHKSLKEGSIVKAGDVIGYLGRTGYSRTENTNNIDEPHLHFGLQLIFDESQKEGNNEIWVDCYELVKFLSMNRSETLKNQETKEYNRIYEMKDPAIPENAQ
ncbi:peptidase [Clostridium sp. chh4-2]|uniref:M23 family metallopeptidase n=1 Tax=Clostridium sp. chh4-2 TaxID=2067550 RepID=UPI000CCFAD50|nr:M23 family metallopeptidase [Clostridium sp. chh4-2]PNV59132.1 peptidase [Clostridium sp. chh4-2]